MSNGPLDIEKIDKKASKGNLMAAIFTVDNFTVVEVCKVTGFFQGKDQNGKKFFALKVEEAQSGENDVSFDDSTNIDSIGTLYATHSPGCRYVKVGGKWKKVCRP